MQTSKINLKLLLISPFYIKIGLARGCENDGGGGRDENLACHGWIDARLIQRFTIISFRAQFPCVMRAMHSELIDAPSHTREKLAVSGHVLLRAKIYKKGDRSQSHNSAGKASFARSALNR